MCGARTTVSPRNFFKWSEKSFEEISWFLYWFKNKKKTIVFKGNVTSHKHRVVTCAMVMTHPN